jgi:plastocyanin
MTMRKLLPVFAVLALQAHGAWAADASITIDNFTFSPPTLVTQAGTKVVWTNRDDIPHLVADADHPTEMKSPPLDTGDTFAVTFSKPGTYHYFCVLHPMMRGTIVVR